MTQRALAVLLLVLVSPLLAVLAIAVRIDGGPVVFRQIRLGVRRRPFTIYKLRTMEAGRVTSAGRLLRRTGYAQLAPSCDRALSWSLDDFYARHRSVRLDLRIVAASCLALVLGKQRAKGWLWG